MREFFPFGKLRVRMTIHFPLQLAVKSEDPAIEPGLFGFAY
jgi:hypothetical protein